VSDTPTNPPAPAPAPVTPAQSVGKWIWDQARTFAIGFLAAMIMGGQIHIPTPTPPAPVPVPVPVPPTPTPTPVPVPVVADFFRVGQAYGKALAGAYGDAWDANFQVQPGDDLDAKLAAVKSAWDGARTAAFGATVAPEFDKLAPNRKAVDQPTADALNKARADFTRGLRTPG
jgi:hypothetical protein